MRRRRCCRQHCHDEQPRGNDVLEIQTPCGASKKTTSIVFTFNLLFFVYSFVSWSYLNTHVSSPVMTLSKNKAQFEQVLKVHSGSSRLVFAPLRARKAHIFRIPRSFAHDGVLVAICCLYFCAIIVTLIWRSELNKHRITNVGNLRSTSLIHLHNFSRNCNASW